MGFAGNSWSVQRLVDEHYVSLYRYAYRLSGSVADAEDLTQEAFCQAQEKRHQLRDPARAKNWLFSILRNAYLHRVRSDKLHHLTLLENMEEMPELPSQPLPAVDPERLQQVLKELPEVFRTPVILYYFDEFSYRDIAEQMDLPLGTVMSRLARAKAYLRSRLLQLEAEIAADGQRRATNGL